jgi:hypothetical protein
MSLASSLMLDVMAVTPAYGAPGASRAPAADEERCHAILDDAIVQVRQQGREAADDIFDEARRACPQSAGPPRELAAVRFAQGRWREAVALAREALDRDPHDASALEILGSSLFMQNDFVGALRAWNRIGRPRIDRVRIDGIHQAQYRAIASALDVRSGSILRAGQFLQVTRRLNELADRSTVRLALRPDAEDSAVDLVITEHGPIPRGGADWTALAVTAAVDRAETIAAPGFTGQGEVWSATWRWWTNRPRVAIGVAAPQLGRLPGVWRAEVSWDAQTYAIGDAKTLLRESRTHAGLAVSGWVRSSWRYSIVAGMDAWDGGRRAASIGASLERRLLADRVSLMADVQNWTSVTAAPGFRSIAASATWRSPAIARGWAYTAAAGAQHVTNAAPLGLWPGAGDGHARAELLRAHPLLDDGVIDLTGPSTFGRTLMYANAEGQRWFERSWPTRAGVAVFADLGRASRTPTRTDGLLQVDIGTGLRLRIPVVNRVLRVDVAHGLRDGAKALTVGWVF